VCSWVWPGRRSESPQAIGLALLSIGAIAFHIKASDRVVDMVPAVIGIALGAVTAVLHTL
jgi:hypothetical protein